MKLAGLILAGCLALWAPLERSATPQETRFEILEVWLETGAQPLAVWQVLLTDESGNSRLVGIEGGAAPFDAPPHYDRRALQERGDGTPEHVRLASFQLADDGPRGRVHVATLHLALTGGAPSWHATVEVAAAPGGRRIQTEVELQ